MTTTTHVEREKLRLLPLYRSELSRVTHRRLLRVLALILLGGIVLISLISFATSRSTAGFSDQELERVRAEEQGFYDDCLDSQPDGRERRCGRNPAERPLESFAYGEDRRYKAKQNLPIVALVTMVAAAGVAFIAGASSGGAEWSSRSMTLQLLWEPRRLRLLGIKWAALVTTMVGLALLAVLLALGLGAVTATLRGMWTGPTPAELSGELGPLLVGMGIRGLVFVALAATFGYAIAILVRNTGAALGAAFVYFLLVETALRIALMRFGPEPFILSTNSIAFLFPGGLDVPGPENYVEEYGGYELSTVHLGNLRALLTLACYALLLIIPAGWSFSRRDVG